MDSAAPKSFLCPIGMEIMRDPVVCADGYSYERVQIERRLATQNTSPYTGAELSSTMLTPNHALRNSIEEWLTANFKLVPRSAVAFEEAALSRVFFKSVHRGTLRGRAEPIAVLRMRAGGFCEEAAAKLVRLRYHPSLVRYLGLCTEGPEHLLLTELAPLGSLSAFLEAHEAEVTLAHKLTMLEQICAGMIALSCAGIVHCDLAARNVLVFAFDAAHPGATVVKIGDFGLAVDRMYQTHATVEGEEVSFRWMPPEALRRRRFSEKSDVWAFGVTAWELLTGGDVPYAFIGSNEAVAERVCSGERLARPDKVPDSLWALLKRSWAAMPADRPMFTQVAVALADMQWLATLPPCSSSHEYYIRVKDLCGQRWPVQVASEWLVEDLKAALQEKSGVPVDQQRLFFVGKELKDFRTLGDYEIANGAELHLVLRLRGGCIASPLPALFGAHTGSPGLEFLTGAPGSADEARALIAALGGSLDETPRVHPAELLDADACAALVRTLDEHAASAAPSDAADVRLSLTDAALERLIGGAALARLREVFGGPWDAIKLRRAAAEGQCVAFHCDYSKRTMQVALNAEDDFGGGKLTFATADGFVQPARPRGSATTHANSLVHGVSTLTRGVRYGLFLCDTKGPGVELGYLNVAARAQLGFFERALALLDGATDADLRRAVREYAAVLAEGGAGGAPTSLAVELAWRTHLLSPLRYADACAVHHGRPVEHQPAHAYAEDAPVAAAGSPAAAAFNGSLEWLGLDLVAAMRRQQRFMRDALACRKAYDSEEVMAAAVDEYRAFLDHFHHSARELVPTAVVDLVWHTHMLDPLRYSRETRVLAGRFVNHEDDVAPERLANTARLCWPLERGGS